MLIKKLITASHNNLTSLIRYNGTVDSGLSESVASHTCIVLFIARIISEDLINNHKGLEIDLLKVYEYALFHDYDECCSGDLSTIVKYADKEFLEKYNALVGVLTKQMLEKDFEGNNNIQKLILRNIEGYEKNKFDKIENQIVKFSDIIQIVTFSIQQINIGNKYYKEILENSHRLLKENFGDNIYFKDYIYDLEKIIIGMI